MRDKYHTNHVVIIILLKNVSLTKNISEVFYNPRREQYRDVTFIH